MSKMSDMAQTIEELRSAATAINEAANWLEEQFSGSGDVINANNPATKAEKKLELTLEDVRAVLAEKSRIGHTAAIRTLLQKYGASKLSGVDPKHYEDLLKDAEVLEDAN
ncbi:MAG: DNA ligase [Anaerotignaceae bacterium]